jgi:MarR family transcriptional regulator, organic hydroperoxide resistance regulator
MHQGHELAMLLRKAYLTFHRRANARVIKFGVTADQFVVLTMLTQEEGITQITLVERTASDPNTVAAILRLLERRGLIRRETHAQDGRARCVFLTGEGRRIQRRVAREADRLLRAMWNAVDPAARQTMLRSLRQIHACFSIFSASKTAANGQPRRTSAKAARRSSRR